VEVYPLAGRRWPVTLQHGDVLLRPMRLRDATDWERVRQHNAAWLKPWEATLPSPAGAGPQSYAALVRSMKRQARAGRMLPWLIIYQPGEQARSMRQRPALAGQLTVSNIVGGSAGSAQIGYWVDQRLAGRGLTPTAVAMATDYCFQTLSLHRIEIAIRPENMRSLRVVQKLGFRPEGMRPRYLHIDGDWRDHLIFALNADEVSHSMVAAWERTRAVPADPSGNTDREPETDRQDEPRS
jgi:ribosomal-protein-alanine N-acetyltransferase